MEEKLYLWFRRKVGKGDLWVMSRRQKILLGAGCPSQGWHLQSTMGQMLGKRAQFFSSTHELYLRAGGAPETLVCTPSYILPNKLRGSILVLLRFTCSYLQYPMIGFKLPMFKSKLTCLINICVTFSKLPVLWVSYPVCWPLQTKSYLSPMTTRFKWDSGYSTSLFIYH